MAQEDKGASRVDLCGKWRNNLPVSRVAAEQMLTFAMPPNVCFQVQVDERHGGVLSVNENDVMSDSRQFDLAEGIVYPGMMIVSAQERGLGTHAMANYINFFSACGVGSLKIGAGLDAGAYTWARFGALPDDPRDYNIWDNVIPRYRAIRPALSDKDRHELDAVVADRSPESVWRVADVRTDVGFILHDVFQRDAMGSHEDHVILKNVSLAFNRCDVGKRVTKAGMECGDMPMGQYLLAGASWDGHIDISNPDSAQMKRVSQYVQQKTGRTLQVNHHRASVG